MTTTASEKTSLPESIKPRLRGWLHAGALPVTLVAGFVLVALGPTLQARLAAVIYAITSGLLFGISATYHRGRLSPRLEEVLRRLDHANIYLIIAGTYTPFALLALDGSARVVVLSVVWAGAVAGVLFRVLWTQAPRWLSTALYIALGWTAVFVLPQLAEGAGVAAVALIFVGGVLYTVGGVVYGLRRPDPSPRWFGFHEVFHAFTLAAYLVQYIAVSLVVYGAS
ncbi:PAQR family membrane homeostasis protein TrhA [Planomonospora parontospora]|uniref:PAQR family membrane homeostasis protein TrhA n=1 Tax=Planomonospora parontospora TaxID=58119 RepID=UPI0016713DFF|nr:hemolysin III family protein [Planomonospora parontospora]GGL30884.1 DNA-binding protein [Planomonospora parontospora subsp. antibiotica]GII16649.1 DNA-binding protein [Planomonospora parontospora subsp. antibiotica]